MFQKMMTVEESTHIIEISANKEDWEGWPKKFLARGRHNSWYELLISADQGF